ncbi:NAD(P)H-hydrate dehydratase [Micromonospora zamorensis]|uniref:ADP-dependent (S)-NAD(P)H-hydrate dehydratase n=3 Tax=Micromonospora TaxID=1873 RepID=A0A3N9WUB9_9ACTN|nr:MULTISPECIES: NAD(P)H-hydrate dehydratase [Micromonospora]RQW99275.1 NAD(P)H-hydrate dehydratase [Micromonospora inaquosa]RQX04475.1 NAD(P)H-hydrate dehydratase [Micromonospora arida]WSK48407.1 NAD(P)H-hydrate dehydratase [Micromonospora zamorensis]
MRSVDEVLAAFCADDIRAAELPVLARLPEGGLMDRAAAALNSVCARILRENSGGVYGRRVVMLVGSGNNGGDALLAGARLQRGGAQVTAAMVGGHAYERGLRAFVGAGGRVIDAREPAGEDRVSRLLERAELVLDGIVGISGRPGLSGVSKRLAAAVPRAATVVAVDMPSGLDPDTGEIHGDCLAADVTVSFGTLKPCLLLPPAAHVAGRLVHVPVGIDEGLPSRPYVRRLTDAGVAARWPVPNHAGHKYTRGVLGVVAGSDAYPGAAVLAVLGAQRAGVGIVRFIGPRQVTDHVLRAVPEAVPGKGRVQAWLLGSGVESDTDQDEAIDQALASGLPCVVDAGALAACVRQRSGGVRAAEADTVLLTPHAGEVSQMLGQLGTPVPRSEVEARPAFYATLLAKQVDATVLLKGPTTLVASPEGWLSSQNDGPSWLATAGTGDVLAGIAGALMAQGVGAMDAGAMAAFVHGRAGARASAGGPIAAGDVAAATPAVIAGLLTSRSSGTDGWMRGHRFSSLG